MNGLWKAVVLAAASALLMTGCGGSPQESNTTPSEGAPETKQVTGDITVSNFRFADPSEIGLVHVRLADEFNASQDAIKITQKSVPYAEVETILVNAVLGGAPPDLASIGPASLPSLAEYLEPLDQYWEAEGADFQNAFGEASKALASYDGHVYGIVVEQNTTDGIWYNKEVLAAAGVDPEEAVKSWGSFTAALQRIKDAGYTPMMFEGMNASRMDRHWGWYANGGADLSDPSMYITEMCKPESQETFEWLVDLYKKGFVPNPAGVAYQEATRAFAAGDVGFYPDGPWAPPTFAAYNEGIVDKIGVTHFPPKTEGGNLSVNIDGLLWVIPKGSPNPDAAWEVMKYMTSEDAQLKMLANNQIPTRTALLDTPEVKDNAIVSFFAEEIDAGGFPRPRAPWMAEFKQTWITGYQSALIGEQSTADAFTSICEQVKTLG